MKKRIITLLLSACLLLVMAVPALAAKTEDSVIQTVQALGILCGDQNGNLDLDQPVTRSQFAKMLTCASVYKDTISDEGSGYSLFTDVKSSHWASEYIRLALEQGWMVGYTDGTFRPERSITLEEACAALLKLLGYDSASLAGSFPYAQLNKASALGLRDQVSAVRGTELTRKDCAYLFYNLMTAQNSGGQVHATSLGYSVTNGEVDYTAIILETVSGPYVAETDGVSLPIVPSTIYRNGEMTDAAAISQYDVYYYNAGLNTLWIYTDRVSGKISEIAPSSTAPTSVTISGVTYTIGSSEATYKLSALGGGAEGNMVTLLLGMDGTVVDVLTDSEVDMTYYGVVQSSSKSVSTEGSAVVQTNVSVACTDGVVRTFTVDKDTTYSEGRVVSASISNDGVVLKSLSDKTISGKVNKDATKLGDRTISADVEILDATKEGDAVSIAPERLAGETISSSHVRYYTLDENEEISHLILNDATGDIWSYGYMTKVEDLSQPESMSINMKYTYVLNGTSTTISSSTKYAVESGGLAIRYNSDGSIKTMKNTASTKITSLGTLTAKADNKTYSLADDVQVYLRQNGEYYLTDLASVNTEDHTITGYYDDFGCPLGGQIRVLVAVVKN